MKRDFFLVVPLGAEEEAHRELLEVAPYLVDIEGWPLVAPISNVNIVKGGIEFQADIAAGLQLHYWLKIPVRILLRLFHFKCKDRRDFKKPLEKAVWLEWLSGSPAAIKVESSASGVWNESWVAEETQKYLDKKFAGRKSPATVYMRGLENQWMVSLDLTGEPLFKRGWATAKEKAPLRENLAVLGLRELIKGETWDLPNVTLADPFAGSGTILSEGFHLFDLSTHRSFAFESEPICPKLLRDKKILTNYRVPMHQSFKGYFATEIDEKTFRTAKENLKQLPQLQLVHSSFDQHAPKNTRVWILTNPPYEKRVKMKGASEGDWLSQVIEIWKPERISFFFPKDKIKELSWPETYQKVHQLNILHGGIPVQIVTLKK